MALHRVITTPGIYFITFTCHDWLPLIDMVDGYDLVYKWFDVLVSRGHVINGYVIMPNHIHLLLYYNGGKKSLNTVTGNGKRFIAYGIVERLKKRNEHAILNKLAGAVTVSDRSRGKKHEVWKDAFDAKLCYTEQFCLQKLIYIHRNPCSGVWNLAESIIDYPHSSAKFYICNKQGIYPVRDYREYLKYGDED